MSRHERKEPLRNQSSSSTPVSVGAASSIGAASSTFRSRSTRKRRTDTRPTAALRDDERSTRSKSKRVKRAHATADAHGASSACTTLTIWRPSYALGQKYDKQDILSSYTFRWSMKVEFNGYPSEHKQVDVNDDAMDVMQSALDAVFTECPTCSICHMSDLPLQCFTFPCTQCRNAICWRCIRTLWSKALNIGVTETLDISNVHEWIDGNACHIPFMRSALESTDNIIACPSCRAHTVQIDWQSLSSLTLGRTFSPAVLQAYAAREKHGLRQWMQYMAQGRTLESLATIPSLQQQPLRNDARIDVHKVEPRRLPYGSMEIKVKAPRIISGTYEPCWKGPHVLQGSSPQRSSSVIDPSAWPSATPFTWRRIVSTGYACGTRNCPWWFDDITSAYRHTATCPRNTWSCPLCRQDIEPLKHDYLVLDTEDKARNYLISQIDHHIAAGQCKATVRCRGMCASIEHSVAEHRQMDHQHYPLFPTICFTKIPIQYAMMHLLHEQLDYMRHAWQSWIAAFPDDMKEQGLTLAKWKLPGSDKHIHYTLAGYETQLTLEDALNAHREWDGLMNAIQHYCSARQPVVPFERISRPASIPHLHAQTGYDNDRKLTESEYVAMQEHEHESGAAAAQQQQQQQPTVHHSPVPVESGDMEEADDENDHMDQPANQYDQKEVAGESLAMDDAIDDDNGLATVQEAIANDRDQQQQQQQQQSASAQPKIMDESVNDNERNVDDG